MTSVVINPHLHHSSLVIRILAVAFQLLISKLMQASRAVRVHQIDPTSYWHAECEHMANANSLLPIRIAYSHWNDNTFLNHATITLMPDTSLSFFSWLSLTHNNVAINCDGSERQHRGKHRGTLQQGDQVAERSSKSPAVAVEGVRHRQWNAAQTHQQVACCQVTDEEVGDVVEFLVGQDASQQECVSNACDDHHEAIKWQEEWSESLKKLHAYKHVQWVTVVKSLALVASRSSGFMAAVSRHSKSSIHENIHLAAARPYEKNDHILKPYTCIRVLSYKINKVVKKSVHSECLTTSWARKMSCLVKYVGLDILNSFSISLWQSKVASLAELWLVKL